MSDSVRIEAAEEPIGMALPHSGRDIAGREVARERISRRHLDLGDALPGSSDAG